MKMQWSGSQERGARAVAVVSASALLFACTLAAGGHTTTEPTRTSRLHHASSGKAQAAPPVTPAKPEAAKPGTKPGTTKPAKPGTAKQGTINPPVTSKAKPPVRRRKKRPEPEDVNDPITMYRTGVVQHPPVPVIRRVPGAEVAQTTETGAAAEVADTNPTLPPEVAARLNGTVLREVAPEVAGTAAEPMASPETFADMPFTAHQPTLEYAHNGRVVMPAPLRGSHEVLVHQNLMADDEHLDRIQDDAQLDALIAHRQLVDFPEAAGLRVNPALPGERRVARVWTVRFAEDMARNFYERFHTQLTVSSAVRTVAYQLHLRRTNGNAAGIDGEDASPHLTGQAIDIAKHGMTLAQVAWMRAYLLPLMEAGKIDVEEEFKQACFHISVYKSYMPVKKRVVEVAERQ